MYGSSLPLVALALAIDVALGVALLGSGALAGRPVIVGPPAPVPAQVPAGPVGIDPVVRSRLTADDVARGVWALATEPASPGLSPAQRAALAPRLARGAALRATLGPQRMARRAEAQAWVDASRDLALALPAGRPAPPRAASGPSAPPPGAPR